MRTSKFKLRLTNFSEFGLLAQWLHQVILFHFYSNSKLMKIKNYFRDFLGEIYSEQLFLSPVSSLVRKPFVFVKNHIYVGITSSFQYVRY